MSAVSNPSGVGNRRALVVIVATLVLYAASRWWIQQVVAGSVSAVIAALVPLPGLLYVYTAWILRALRGDELERRIALEGLAIGFGVTFAFVALLSQLEHAMPAGALNVDYGEVALVALFASFIGVTRSRSRYE